jgi:hypothetical protein
VGYEKSLKENIFKIQEYFDLALRIDGNKVFFLLAHEVSEVTEKVL